jgi:hypothetical protein
MTSGGAKRTVNEESRSKALSSTHLVLAAQWHLTLNVDSQPSSVTASAKLKHSGCARCVVTSARRE